MRNLVAVAYNSTNHYLIECRGGRLLVDPGFAGTLPQLRHGLQRFGVQMSEIKYVVNTHLHPDHAGLTQEVKRASGARLLIHERQVPFLSELLSFYQHKSGYDPIVVDPDDIIISSEDSREALRTIGIDGEVVETRGHSDDSISLVLDGGDAFTGDLNLPSQVDSEKVEEVCDSWRRMLALGARTFYPSHVGGVSSKVIEEALRGFSSSD